MPMTGFEPGSSGVGSDRSANHVTTTAKEYIKFVLFTFLTLGIIDLFIDAA